MAQADESSNKSTPPPCPKCGKPLRRVRRRPIDHVISKVVPVHRYQCKASRCGWVGNLRQAK